MLQGYSYESLRHYKITAEVLISNNVQYGNKIYTTLLDVLVPVGVVTGRITAI